MAADSFQTLGLKTSAAKYLPAGSVLFSSRAPVGHVAIAANPVTTNQGFRSFVPNGELDSSFLYYALKYLKPLAQSRASGTTFPELSGSKASELPIAYPHRQTQARIAQLLDGVTVKARAARMHLNLTQQALLQFRAAVLSSACAGPAYYRLAGDASARRRPPTDSCRARTVPSPPLRAVMGAGVIPDLTDEERSAVPATWRWLKVSDLALPSEDAVQIGPMSMKSSEFVPTGVLVLNVGCVQPGFIDTSKADHLPQKRARDFSPRYEIKEGDVLFTRSGTVGRCAVARETHNGSLITFHLLRVRPDPQICLPDYLLGGLPRAPRQ